MASLTSKRKSRDDDAYPVDEVRTPTGSPPKKRLRVTRNQKQALIDNLQLEITERARKLRAQYALQANDLRARIERRINRIPIALRKVNMGELLEKHNAALRAQQENTSPRKFISPIKGSRFAAISAKPAMRKASAASPSPRRTKRQSHEGLYSDKENAPAAGEQLDVLKNPKRRAKPGAAAGTSRVVSQEVRGADFRILSPKSSNSRTYPQSPLRASPEKPQNSSYLSRPMPSLKPSSPLKAAPASLAGSLESARLRTTKGTPSAATASRPASQASRRPASRATTASKTTTRSPLPRPATRQLERRGSVSSSTSSGTTVTKPTRTGANARKVTAASTASSTAKKAVANSQATSATAKRSTASATRKTAAPAGGEAPTAGRRVLRKRA
ncbi:Borealin N terminal-domain-containing protein [Aspergillus pseudonomiae]|uniref:Borealin N terminal-domain-containing protein n=1 Tax=Aspergillus pseudonomiae TaxID=1506151 RepID=A0A5N7D6D4_9EURO|nr:Borealin N terminal-domain-containing protein [Aspergillus pseudonomiae]KAB8265323.1 Borealin N terminal-domain-containing protein [Aspergillus pseudonomiae]KAE8401972.1 Borealin N terminal-domain-containing protein [Aspergillus pseudonomiae]